MKIDRDQQKLVSLGQAAEMLLVDEQALLDAVQSEELAAVRQGDFERFDVRELLRFKRERLTRQ
ncbi:MAG: hypothetical protein P9M14_06070 [Candidatus Alcyoniella australis]|nr:hypothetical protein [Candidatus Alcyoniella australis]